MSTLQLKERLDHIRKIYVILTGTEVTRDDIKDNEFVIAWGAETCYLLVENKYIVAGSGDVCCYLDQRLKVKLRDDGNGTTDFGYWVESKIVNVYANDIDSFVSQLPDGRFRLYAMK